MPTAKLENAPSMTDEAAAIGSKIPYRMALAGGWIDQPFLSRLNPQPPGSMVVVSLDPVHKYMDRCGMATSTRKIAARLWPGGLPEANPAALVRQLYDLENRDKPEPSGSQDMAGLIYPGVSRLDYDYRFEGGYFPCNVESNNDPQVARWLESVIHVVSVAPRPDGYGPLGIKNLDAAWVARLGQSGRDCYNAIVAQDTAALGASMNECMVCWETLLPHTVVHPTLKVDLKERLAYYQARNAGAMYSGCGGGYLFVVSEGEVADSFKVKIRLQRQS